MSVFRRPRPHNIATGLSLFSLLLVNSRTFRPVKETVKFETPYPHE